jgi:DNA-binding IclR family transcriptional regulator
MDMATNKTPSSLYRVQVLDRALAIIEALAHMREEASLAEIAALVKVHKSTVHRLIMSLEKHRLIDRDAKTGHYRLGLRLFDLGALAASRFDIRHRARPYLEKLLYNANETVHLCVLDDGEMLYLDKIEPKRSVRLSCTVGRRNPVHCTGVGKAVLAWLAEEEIDEIIHQRGLRRFTPKTLTTPAELKADLKLTRERGYALDDEEHEEGVRCIAAMVRDYTGQPAAAISTSAPSFRLPMEKVPILAPLVCATAQAVSLEWGYRLATAEPASFEKIRTDV